MSEMKLEPQWKPEGEWAQEALLRMILRRVQVSAAIVLMTVDRDGSCHMEALTAAMGHTKTATTDVVTTLLRRGLVTRTGRVEGDRRKVFVELTEKGRELVRWAVTGE